MHRPGPVGEQEPQHHQLEDPVGRAGVQQEAAVARLADELAGEPGGADRPGPAHAGAEVLASGNLEPGRGREPSVVALVAHVGQPTLAADRLEQVAQLPAARTVAGEPRAYGEATAGPQRAPSLGEEVP